MGDEGVQRDRHVARETGGQTDRHGDHRRLYPGWMMKESRETDTWPERQTRSQTDTVTTGGCTRVGDEGVQRDRHVDRQTDTWPERQVDRQTRGQRDRYVDRQTDTWPERETGGQRDRWTDRQTR